MGEAFVDLNSIPYFCDSKQPLLLPGEGLGKKCLHATLSTLFTIGTSISDAWKRAQGDVVAESFMKFSITNHFNATEDDLLGDTESGGATDSNGTEGID